MKIAHVTTYCLAGSTGGTERYIADLAAGLQRRGHDNRILWLTTEDGPVATSAGVPVHRLPRADMRVDAPPPSLAARARVLLDGTDRPDLLHFHTFGRSEAVLAELAVERGLPYAFTYHSPAWTCRRETLLRWGEVVCDGEVRALRCSACKLQERLPGSRWMAWAGALASAAAGPLIPPGPWRRRLAFTADTARYRDAVRKFLGACGQSVACAEWSVPVLLANGARAEKLMHQPQGVPDGFAGGPRCAPSPDVFVVGSIGRMNEVKGLHILVEAFRRVAYPKARLRLCGWSETPALRAYGRLLKDLAGEDPRIAFVPEKPPSEIPAEYAGLSLLAIPSVWMETGPLTLLEALQAGVPVFGSSHIGQLGLLKRYGRVVDPNTPFAWTQALEEACARHAQGRWQAVRLQEPIPTMDDVAARMEQAYRGILAA